MDYKYNNFLPNYLEGQNIRNHGNNITRQDKIVANKNMMLNNWNKLSPPILIERVCTADDENIQLNYILHVSVDEFIERIEVDNEIIVSFPYSDAVMEYEDIIVDELVTSESFCNNPQVRVDVYTYADNVYSKGYPENDVHDETVFDHDENLDRVGALFGLERRTYNSYNNIDGADSIPAFFGKENIEGVVQSCTEDDYYYLQRLLYLISHYQTMDLCKLYMYLIYNVDLEISHEYEEYDIQQGNFLYILDKNTRFAVNIDEPPLGQELSADPYLGKFIPVSREAYVLKNLTFYRIVWTYFAQPDGVKRYRVLDINGEPLSNFIFDTQIEEYGIITSSEHGEFSVYPYIEGEGMYIEREMINYIRSVYPLDESWRPLSDNYDLPKINYRYTFGDTSMWTNRSSSSLVHEDDDTVSFNPNCNAVYEGMVMHRDQTYYTSLNLIFSSFNLQNRHILIFYVDNETEYYYYVLGESDVPDALYVTPTGVMVIKEGIILKEYSFTEEFKLGLKAGLSMVTWNCPTSYISSETPVPPVTVTEYGLGTDNPWTADNTLNPVWHSGLQGALATNYTKQSTGTTVNIPLSGDFEITFKLNVTGNVGTGWFALYDGQSNVVEVNMNNTLNGSTINTVFPNPDTGYNMNTETYTLKREGTTYTYKHGNETRTLTINNTNPLYLKMRKTGNADMFISTMSVTGGGQ